MEPENRNTDQGQIQDLGKIQEQNLNTIDRLPPTYYHEYASEEELLNKYKANPRYVAAIGVISSPYVLAYAISVTAILIYFIIQKDFIHPFYVLLCIAGWITVFSGMKSKKNNSLPNVSGLSLSSGVCTALLVVSCIGLGAMILMLGATLVSLIGFKGGDGKSVLTASLLLVASLLILWLCIKFYSVQARNLKSIRHCITNDEFTPKKISVFPSIAYVIITAVSLISVFIVKANEEKLDSFIKDSFNTMRDTLITSGMSSDLVNTLMDEVQEYVNASSIATTVIITSILGGINNVVIALFYFRAASALNPHLSDY